MINFATLSFILGLSVMFFGLTAWLFFRKGGWLSVIVASLKVLMGLQCGISFGLLLNDKYVDAASWPLITCLLTTFALIVNLIYLL